MNLFKYAPISCTWGCWNNLNNNFNETPM
jgi:hypothetical protein